MPSPSAPTGKLTPAHFRFRELDGAFLLTTDVGDWLWLDAGDFHAFSRGRMATDHPRAQELRSGGFVAGALDTDRILDRLRSKARIINGGPWLHVIAVTLRCNHTCLYCHSTRAPKHRTEADMTLETADRVVDTIMGTPSSHVTIELQGGEPLLNFPAVQRIVERARDKGAARGKDVRFVLMSNLTLMTEERLQYIVDNRIHVLTSLDGPEGVHNANRFVPRRNTFRQTVRWIRRIDDAYRAAGLDPSRYRTEALLTTTRDALPRWKEVVDTYVEAGCGALFLRAMDPFGFANRTASRLGYSVAEFLEMYGKAVDYIIDLNRQGVDLMERTAGVFLARALAHREPDFLDIRSPCGAGIGQVAYDHDGAVYTCDEGRMMHGMGDDAFLLGQAGERPLTELVDDPTVRSLVLASTLDGQPSCSQCAYKPYCGVCPVFHYAEHGSIHGRLPESPLCKRHMGIQDYLFRTLRRGDEQTRTILMRWAGAEGRPDFVRHCAGL